MTGPPKAVTEAPNLEDLPLEGPPPEVTQGDVLSDSVPPLRMHAATRVTERLHSSTSALPQVSSAVGGGSNSNAAPIIGATGAGTGSPVASPALHHHVRRRSSSELKGARSRSRSPSLRETDTSNSSVSSLEDLANDDILTDRMGLEELDIEKQRSVSEGLHVSVSSLPPVTERMCEDTLEDVHAFSDVSHKSGTHSRGTSIATGGDVGSFGLETLDEGEEEEREEEDIGVHISNMENLTIHEEQSEEFDHEEGEFLEEKIQSKEERK